MVGGPSQMDLFDYKPKMDEWYDKDLPDSVRMGQRLTTMTSGQTRFPIAPSKFKFAQHGKCGMWVSELLPYTAKMVDDMCFIRSMHTEAINHEPAITLHADRQPDHRPALPRVVGLVRPGLAEPEPADVRRAGRQAVEHRAGAGDLRPALVVGLPARASTPASPSAAAATRSCTSTTRPASPRDVRRKTLDGLKALNEMNYKLVGDPETHTRIEQYEMAFRMQSSVPELTDLANEPESTYALYGDDGEEAGHASPTPALLARRLVERGVRFVQIYHNNWDHHGNVGGPAARPVQRRRPALLRPDPGPEGTRPARRDAGHLGRRVRPDDLLAGRPLATRTTAATTTRAASPCGWPAAARRPGTIYGETDDFSYNIVKDPVHIRDFHATVLHLLGFDHERFTYRYQGLDQKLTGVEKARVIKELLA